jgi:hypothetical protein
VRAQKLMSFNPSYFAMVNPKRIGHSH